MVVRGPEDSAVLHTAYAILSFPGRVLVPTHRKSGALLFTVRAGGWAAEMSVVGRTVLVSVGQVCEVGATELLGVQVCTRMLWTT